MNMGAKCVDCPVKSSVVTVNLLLLSNGRILRVQLEDSFSVESPLVWPSDGENVKKASLS